MTKKHDQFFRLIASLDNHFAAADVSPADADRWRELKRQIVRMKDDLDLARIELESLERGAPKIMENRGQGAACEVWARRERS